MRAGEWVSVFTRAYVIYVLKARCLLWQRLLISWLMQNFTRTRTFRTDHTSHYGGYALRRNIPLSKISLTSTRPKRRSENIGFRVASRVENWRLLEVNGSPADILKKKTLFRIELFAILPKILNHPQVELEEEFNAVLIMLWLHSSAYGSNRSHVKELEAKSSGREEVKGRLSNATLFDVGVVSTARKPRDSNYDTKQDAFENSRQSVRRSIWTDRQTDPPATGKVQTVFELGHPRNAHLLLG